MAESVASDTNSEYLPPVAIVKMKDSGDVYIGEIASYPISLDTQSEKDFLLVHATYWKDGSEAPNAVLDFDPVDGIGAVLLNSRDVESVRVIYRRDGDD